jgi:hypothetical protein
MEFVEKTAENAQGSAETQEATSQVENVTVDEKTEPAVESNIKEEKTEEEELVELTPKERAIQEDNDFVTDFIPPAAILAQNEDFITVVIIRTAYAKVQLRIQYRTIDYPNEVPIIELSSPTLPLPLLRNKEKECAEKAQEYLGKPQFAKIYEHIYSFIQSNMFIPCWKEIKQVMTLCDGKGTFGADDKEGILSVRLTSGRFKQSFKFKIPYNYPEEGVQIEFLSSNFPNEIQQMFKSQVEEIIRRCVAGFSLEEAINVSASSILNRGQQLSQQDGNNHKTVKITTSAIKNMKHDVNVLKQMSDLRATATPNNNNNNNNSSSTTIDTTNFLNKQLAQERREARKDLRKLAKVENEAELLEQQRLREEEQQVMQQLLRSKISETSQPSLYPAMKFLLEDYLQRLAHEPCQACKEYCIIPLSEPSPTTTPQQQPQQQQPDKSKRPMRTFCGHWLHWDCLNTWLTTPPFIRQCPVCTKRIWHPDWPEDYKQLEKAWQSKEARKREMADVSTILYMYLFHHPLSVYSLIDDIRHLIGL